MKAAGNIGTSRRIMRADWKCLHMRSLCQGRGGISVSAVSLCHLSSSISFESLHFCHQLQFFSPLFASLLLRHLFVVWLAWPVSVFPFEFVSCDPHLGKRKSFGKRTQNLEDDWMTPPSITLEPIRFPPASLAW